MISFRKFISLSGTLSLLTAGFAAFTACSETETAGGVTDIGNSVAYEGVVVDASGAVVPSARVVAYYDSWDQDGIKDSVVTEANANGEYELKVKENEKIVLFASAGEECGLSTAKLDESNKIFIGKRKAYSSHIAGRNTGRMRVVGVVDSATTGLDADGYFIFYNMPPGDITLSYVNESDGVEVQSRVEFSTTGDQNILVLPELVFVDGDESWLAVQDIRYYVGEGHEGIQIHNPKSEHWTPITELPETDSLPSVVVSAAVPQNVQPMTGFLFPIKIDTKSLPSTVNTSNVVVVNNDKWELYPSEIEYWNDEEALLWARVISVDSGVAELNFKVLESAEYAANLIPFDQGQKYDGVLSKIHFNGTDAKVLNSDKTEARSVADSVGMLGKGVTLDMGQYLSIDSVDMTWGSFTVSLWTKWNGAGDRPQVLISERGDSTYKFQWRYEEGKFSLMKGAPSTTEVLEFGAADQVPADEWTHLALTYENLSGMWTMYVNGEQLGKSAKFSPSYTGTGLFPAHIGGSGVNRDTWDGALDEIRIESVVRSAEWIKAVYETQKAAAE